MSDKPVFCEVDKFLLNVAGTGVGGGSSPPQTPPKQQVKAPVKETTYAQHETKTEPNGLVEGEYCLLVEMPLISYQMPDLTPDDKVNFTLSNLICQMSLEQDKHEKNRRGIQV